MRMALCYIVALLILLTFGVSARGSDFNWKAAVSGDLQPRLGRLHSFADPVDHDQRGTIEDQQ